MTALAIEPLDTPGKARLLGTNGVSSVFTRLEPSLEPSLK